MLTPGYDAALAQVFRQHTARLMAAMTAFTGDFDLAEECVQDALLTAIEHWPNEGLPERPAAWLLTTARRKALDRLRRQTVYQEKIALLDTPPLTSEESTWAEDLLALVFTCCHPALAREAQVALTLRAVMGFTTAEIAAAFLTSPATIAQRIVRAKRAIVATRIPYRVPPERERAERLEQPLAVLYLVFNEGYLSAGGEVARRNLADEAVWLAALLARQLPAEPEVIGLLALMRLHLARAAARFGVDGALVLLRDQDRRLWDRGEIAAAVGLIERAAALRRPGPYQLQAAIAACHAEAESWEVTDWAQIVALYDRLLALAPSPVVRLNRAIARWQIAGPAQALAEVECLATPLARYHLFHATRGELLRALGRTEEARAADREALRRTRNPAERALLARRIG
ncbi:MAG TPA: sigma-70 family RNA polymerase sigma factor [Ktedonobacterales bacterium]|jgi:RNA polymerase sigma factor (sigma-70 family)|nr:sigma-70 family RNA polymerase sigma factor [Ktedonobacterales bacterium]